MSSLDNMVARLGQATSQAEEATEAYKGAVMNVGYKLHRAYEDTVLLTQVNDAVQFNEGGVYYRWDGAFPQGGLSIPQNTPEPSPEQTGAGKYIAVLDLELRSLLKKQTREALRRSYAEAGYNLVAGSFEAGGTLTSATDVLLQETSGRAYSGTTGLVSPGTNPSSGRFIDESDTLLRRQSRPNVLMYGADPLGVKDSTQAFLNSKGAFVPNGTYLVNGNIPNAHPSENDVSIIGNGTVKLQHAANSLSLPPFKLNKTTGGELYTTGSLSLTSNEGEYYRLPVVCSSNFNRRTFLAYAVLVGGKQDIGQSASQTSRIEVRYSKNHLSFNSPTVISTDGSQQASEPAMAFDAKRARLWVFYTTANGAVGVGNGSTGFSPSTTMQTWVTYSDTYGASWATPVNITTKVKPEDATSAWTPPSEICVASNGRLLVPYTWVKSGGKFYHGYIIVEEKQDGSLKYSRQLILAGGTDGSNGGGESQILQIGDGSFVALIRDYYNASGNTYGVQRVYRSYDGLVWVYQSSINTTSCKAAMCQYSAQAFGDSRDVLLVTAPTGNDGSDLYRNNLKLWASTNSGVTWQEFPTPVFGDATISTGYSGIAALCNGAVMIVAEGSLYQSIGVRHKAIGSFTGESTFVRAWGELPVVQTSAERALCQNFDIIVHGLYWNNDKQCLSMNAAGVPVRLTDSQIGVDINTATATLDSDAATTFYLTSTMTLNQITGSAARIVLVSTQASQPVTLTESAGVTISERIRINKTLAGKMIVLWRTKYGWYPDAAVPG